MSQVSTLFACTKCNSRHPFEDLSQGHQLCKDCRSSFNVIKCNYCRTEFHQEIKSSSHANGTKSSSNSSICTKCKQLEEQHGKPGPCAYCNIIAAFIGTKCQRCTNSEKKYGPPLSCEHCKQKCAFDRVEPESKKKVDGKLLCWLCTISYKRTLAKARQKEASKMSSHHKTSGTGGNSHSKGMYTLSSSSSRHHRSHHGTSSSNSQRHGASSNNHTNSSDLPYQRSSSSTTVTTSHTRHSTHDSSSQHNNRDKHRDSHKKQRLEANPSSGLQTSSVSITTMSSIMDSRFIDPTSANDLSAVVTQLKDQVAMLNKKLQMKEKELLSKDQQIAELKATSTREQRETKEKMNTIQKQHSERVSELQAKIISMQKQFASQARASKSNTNSYIEPPLVI